MTSKIFRTIAVIACSAATLTFHAGCNTNTTQLKRVLTENLVITNATPPTLPENPSGLYTFTVSIRTFTTAIVKESLRVSITIDGQTFPMRPSPLGGNLWEYDHAIAHGRSEAAYYVTADYDIAIREGRKVAREAYTELFKVAIANKYALALESIRGPVGSQIAVIGRGFQNGDTVHVGDAAAETRFLSANSLQFTVPALSADQIYPVKVVSGAKEFALGHFRIDKAQLSVAPSSITLRKGERRQVSFQLPTAATGAGLIINVTTDIPASIVMPEVVVPNGATSTTVTLIGGQPGTGSVFVEAPGFDAVTIPVTVL